MNKELYNKYINLASSIIDQVYTKENLRLMEKTIDQKGKLSTQFSKGGELLHRGYYCPSLVKDMLVGNCSRGRLLSKTSKSAPDYCYYYDCSDKLVLVEKNTGCKGAIEVEWMKHTDDLEYSICKTSQDSEEINAGISRYYDGKLSENYFLFSYINDNSFEMEIEKYYYDADDKLSLAKHNYIAVWDENTCSNDSWSLDFIYNDTGKLQHCLINGDGENPVQIPSPVKNLIQKQIEPGRHNAETSLDMDTLLKVLKMIIGGWAGLNIYAVSIFINHDEETVTDFLVSYNLEEGQRGESRWNYAFWDQEEEDLLYLLKNVEITWSELLNAVALSVRALQNQQYLENLFGKKIPVIIHGYEYAEEELEATRLANPDGQAEEFFAAMKQLGITL